MLLYPTQFIEMKFPQKNCFSLYFRKNIACLRAGLVRKYQVFILFPVKLCIGGL